MSFGALIHNINETGTGNLVVQGTTSSVTIDGDQISFDGGETFQTYTYLGQGINSTTGETGEFIEVGGEKYAYNTDDPLTELTTGNWGITEEDLDPNPPPCFVTGTLIRTPKGDVPIEELEVGDCVVTLSGRHAPILWLGHSKVSASMQQRDRSLRAVNIGIGAVGNERPLKVSQQHRILVQGHKVELWFGEPEILVPAKALLHSDRVHLCKSDTEIVYHHLALDRHEVVFANGVPSESLFLGDQLRGCHARELEKLFPDLWIEKKIMDKAAKPMLRVREAQILFV